MPEDTNSFEQAARQIIGLVSGLMGVLLGILSLTADAAKRPLYLNLPIVRFLSVSAIGLWLLALLAALVVVLPWPWMKAAQPEARANLVRRKGLVLWVAAMAFDSGVVALGAILVTAILRA
jgi:hypothetical protein